jgi:outer membrane protein insertion porin family
MRRRTVRGLVAFAIAASAARGALGQDIAPGLLGKTVASVSYTSDGPVDRSEVEGLIAIRAGRPLSESDAGGTIRNLYGMRRFSNVLVEAEAASEDTVAVTVHLWLAYRIGRLEFHGKASPLSREDLRRAVPLAAGDVFNASALAAGASALERRLAAEGYLHPSVEPDATFDPATFEVTLVYNLAPGVRARIAPPFFDGDTAPFTVEELAARGKLKEGSLYGEAKARAFAERIRKFLLGRDFFRANVELIAAEPTEDGRIRPVYRIAVGPRYTLVATGIKEKTARRQILALLEAQGFDDDLLQQWVENRTQELQRHGRYRAKVSATASAGVDPVVVRLAVEPGSKYALEKITFSGNRSVDDKTLRDLMLTRKKGLPLVRKGRLLDTDLEGDVSAILGYYQTHGWIDARVEKPAVTEGSRPDLLAVAIKIEEGPQVFVAERKLEGSDVLGPEEIDGLVSVKVGEPFNPNAVRQDVAALTAYYRNHGWPSASVRDRLTLSEDRTKVDVVYAVDEGMRAFFGKTIVRGNAVTDPDRILKQVAWKEGEPFSEEKIADTQQNLARTGVFRSIEVQPGPADPETQERNVEIELSEARRISLLYGFGYGYAPGATENRNDVFGIVGGTYRNLFGTMRSTSLELQYAPLSGRGHVFASLLEPYLFNTNIPLTFVAFVSRAPIQDIDIDRIGGYLESVRLFHKDTRVGLRYEYQQIAPRNPEDLSTIELEKFPKSDQPIKQSAIGPSLFYDRRDDILDPQRGYYATVAGKYAFPLLNATARYAKVSGQAAWFQRLFGGVLGVSGRIGAIFPYDLAAGVPVPIAERFFAGGSATGRGFDTDLLGIPGVTVDYNTQATLHSGSGDGSCVATYPGVSTAYDCSPGPRIIGGNAFVAWSLEWRFPILGKLGVSLFYDLAQVWERPEDINFRIEGPTGLRQSIGAGFHYLTPIGPLRLEYGLPVEQRTIDFDVTSTVQPDGSPCNPSPCHLATGSTKESGRVLLSIGYPF